jgi:transcriptional regulator with XRE-family HTH domain
MLAAAAGVSVGNLRLIESGRGNPRATTLAAIAAALEISPTSLLIEEP